MPRPNLGHWLRNITLKKASSGCSSTERDPGWAGGMMHQGVNSSSPANQKDKGENTPLTIQLCKPPLPSPPLHQGMLAGSSFGRPAPKRSPVSEGTSSEHIQHASTFGRLGHLVMATQRSRKPSRQHDAVPRPPAALAKSLLPGLGSPLLRISSRASTFPSW